MHESDRAYLAYWLPWSPVWRAGAAGRLHDRLHQGPRLFPRSDAWAASTKSS